MSEKQTKAEARDLNDATVDGRLQPRTGPNDQVSDKDLGQVVGGFGTLKNKEVRDDPKDTRMP